MTNEHFEKDKMAKVAEDMMKKGIPMRASTFAAAMGYLRHLKDKGKNE